MLKVNKRDQAAGDEIVVVDQVNQVAASSSAACLKPVRKRRKAPNFSIAAIMQSEDEEDDDDNDDEDEQEFSRSVERNGEDEDDDDNEEDDDQDQELYGSAKRKRRQQVFVDEAPLKRDRDPSASPGNSSTGGSNTSASSPSPAPSPGSKWLHKAAGLLAGCVAQPNSNQAAGGHTKSRASKSRAAELAADRASPGKQVCLDPRLAPIECHLDNLDLWHRFHPLDTEMIITKQGRRMFPPVRVNFSLKGADARCQMTTTTTQPNSTNQQHSPTGFGANLNQLQLNGRDKYHVLMDIQPYDKKRYRYAYHKSSWQQAGKADPPSPTKLFLHPDGPFTLDQLKRQVISFEKIKLTNNDANKHGYIVLNSMHKYQPRIHLVLWRGKESQNLANAPIKQLEQETHKTFIFSETIFTAVTAYQNHSITKLKIDSNPFAKGFRDSSRLTDLELESMQDLISDGQCPFSPPRAPPHGFPHFLFAQNPNQMEDPASALLRERTIIALDSFLQQQQHHQHQQLQRPPDGSPQLRPPLPPAGSAHLQTGQSVGPPPPQQQPAQSQQQQQHQQPPFNAFFGQSAAGNGQPPAGAGSQPPGNLEQLLMQQHQFAAAMAAAAAHQPLHSLFASGSVAPSMCAGLAQYRTPSCGAPTPTTPTCPSGEPNQSPSGPLSPIVSHQATSQQSARLSGSEQQIALANFHAANAMLSMGSNQVAPHQATFHPQHLQAVIAAHQQQQHQMAALSMQLEQQQQQHHLHRDSAARQQAAPPSHHLSHLVNQAQQHSHLAAKKSL